MLPKHGAGVRHACPAPLGRLSHPALSTSRGHHPSRGRWGQAVSCQGRPCAGRVILLARPGNQSLVQKEVFQQESEAV